MWLVSVNHHLCPIKRIKQLHLCYYSKIGGSKDTQRVLRPTKNGTFPCLECNCCSNCQKGEVVYHPRKGTSIKICGYYTCASSFVVNIIKCPCGLLYVGQTSCPVRERMREQKLAIRTGKKEQAVTSHFIAVGHGIHQLKYQVVDHVPSLRRGGDRVKILLRIEAIWIRKLEILAPYGLNREYDLLAIVTLSWPILPIRS